MEPRAEPKSTETVADATRVARRLLAEACRVVGLLPVGGSGGIQHAMVEVGRALVDHTGQTVALIDVGGGWPLWSDASAQIGSGPAIGRWLHGARLAVLRPAQTPAAGAGVSVLGSLLASARARCPYALVDLSGLRAAGEHFGAFTLVDGVCLIARAGKTRERELLSIYEQLDSRKNLGVLLLST